MGRKVALAPALLLAGAGWANHMGNRANWEPDSAEAVPQVSFLGAASSVLGVTLSEEAK